jgi:hypothetical protein
MHMLVLEEAHRLLSAGHGGGKGGSNSKAQAAEDINTMLAEVRKYGQGVMIIDQRPGSLVGGVIDNAYLVALHRLNEERGFRQFAQQLNLSADQQRYARSELRPGQMIVLDRRSGFPVLVKPANFNTDAAKMSDPTLQSLMKQRVKNVLAAPAVAVPERAAPTGVAALRGVMLAEEERALNEPTELDRTLVELLRKAVDAQGPERTRWVREYARQVARLQHKFGAEITGVPKEERWLAMARRLIRVFKLPEHYYVDLQGSTE